MSKRPVFSESESRFLWNLFNIYYRNIRRGQSEDDDNDMFKIQRIYHILLYDFFERYQRKLDFPKWKNNFDIEEFETVRYEFLATYLEDTETPEFFKGLKS